MSKKVPRRLQRFNREGIEPTEEAMKGLDENKFSYNPDQGESKASEEENTASSKEIATELAMEEVQRFKEKHQRLPEKKEYDSISESIYAQLKDKEQRKKAIERLERKRGKKTGEKGAEENKKDKRKKHGRHGHGKEQEEKKGFKTPEKDLKPEEGSLSSEEIKGMSVEDLFSGNKKGKSEFGELEEISGGKFSLEGLEGMEEKPSASSKCPNVVLQQKQLFFVLNAEPLFVKSVQKSLRYREMLKHLSALTAERK